MRKAGGPAESWVAILGRGQFEADGIQDYCHCLGKALAHHGVVLETRDIEWARLGWRKALHTLRQESQRWGGRWVLVQYTALAFSMRGFPFHVLDVLRILRSNGVRTAVIFHEPFRHGGERLRDHLRGNFQEWVIRRAFHLADRGVFADPLSQFPWLPKDSPKAVSIPIGANIPGVASTARNNHCESREIKTAAIFCLELDSSVQGEVDDLARAARATCDAGVKLRLVFLGRGTEPARKIILKAFETIPAEVSILGLLDAEKVSQTLSAADAMLCVRGPLFARRGSALAGIACGLPIVGYKGPHTCFPITDAGLELVPYRDYDALGKAFCRIMMDDRLREELRNRSLRAYASHFSWERIGEQFVRELSNE
jgi:glycosyltransferase involved in cell wall biosynthesis